MRLLFLHFLGFALTVVAFRHIIETYLSHQWTLDDVERAEHFYNTHNAAFTPYPFPKHLFLKFIAENDGYFPGE